MFMLPTPPTVFRVPGGDLSVVHNGRFTECVFFPDDRGPAREIHDVRSVSAARAFASKLADLTPSAARTVLEAYRSDAFPD